MCFSRKTSPGSLVVVFVAARKNADLTADRQIRVVDEEKTWPAGNSLSCRRRTEANISCHTFRATGITEYLRNAVLIRGTLAEVAIGRERIRLGFRKAFMTADFLDKAFGH